MRTVLPGFMFLISLITAPAYADDSDVAGKVLAQHKEGPVIRELNWLNLGFMDKQRNTVNNLTATHYGKRLLSDKADIFVLQRLVNDEVIKRSDTLQLQALGVALGDILVKQSPNLNWMVYEDEIGATQAICVKDTTHCLFPITMLSRRMEVGLKPDVNKIFNDAMDTMKPLLPKLPYSTR